MSTVYSFVATHNRVAWAYKFCTHAYMVNNHFETLAVHAERLLQYNPTGESIPIPSTVQTTD